MAFEGTIQEFTVSMHGNTLEYPFIEVQQGDTASRRIRIHLKTFDGADFLIPYGATAVLSVDKTDGHKVLNECEIEDSSTIIITLTSQALACPGKQLSQIYIFTDKGDIKTQKFYIHVPKAVYDQDAIKSTDEYGILQDLISRIESLDANVTTENITAALGYTPANEEDVARVRSDLIEYVFPEHYGAKGDGATDDSVAIQTAIDVADGKKLVYLAKKEYKITNGLVLNKRYTNFKCDGTIIYSGTDVAVKIGTSNIIADINSIDAQNGTAVQFDGSLAWISLCDIKIKRIRSSVIGLHLFTDTNSITYNKVNVDDIVSSEIGVYVQAEASYINENSYHLNHIQGGCSKGIYVYSDSSLAVGDGYGTNSNKFFSGSFEGISEDGCSILLENTTGNIFEKFRCAENYGKNSIVLKGITYGNTIELSNLNLTEVDISELADIKAQYSVLRTYGSRISANGKVAGLEARASSRFGITYNPSEALNSEFDVTSENFPDNVIKQVRTTIPGYIHFNDVNLKNKTFTVGYLYSGHSSLACGFPLTMKFSGTQGGLVKLVDSNGDLILDNTSGRYNYKIVSVRWSGFDMYEDTNIWDVKVLGESVEGFIDNHNDDKNAHGGLELIVANLQSQLQLANDLLTSLYTKLPSEYQRVEYIQSDGNQYLDTGVLASNHPDGLKYVFDGVITNADASIAEYMWGALNSGKRSGYPSINDTAGKFHLAIGGHTAASSVPLVIGERFKLEVTATSLDPNNATMVLNGTINATFENTATATDMPPLNITLLKANGSSATKYAQTQIYGFMMYKANGTPIRYFVPCYRVSDGVIGLYDTVNGAFYENKGTGKFTKGTNV